MGSPPAVPGQEAPQEELPGLGRQPVQPTAGHVDGHHPRPFGDDVGDPQPVAEGELQRLPDTEHQDRHDGDEVEADPVGLRERVGQEIRPDDQLVGEAEGHPQVGVQVDVVPGFVRQAPASDPDGGDADGHQHHQADGRHEHVRVGRQE